IFPGSDAEGAYILRSFLDAFTSERFIREYSIFAVGLLTAALSVSELVANRAGFAATMRTAGSNGELVIPTDAKISQLRGAVSFATQELEGYLASRRSMTLRTLAPLISGIGNVPGIMEVERNPLRLTPIIQAKGHLIVSTPSALHVAAVHRAL